MRVRVCVCVCCGCVHTLCAAVHTHALTHPRAQTHTYVHACMCPYNVPSMRNVLNVPYRAVQHATPARADMCVYTHAHVHSSRHTHTHTLNSSSCIHACAPTRTSHACKLFSLHKNHLHTAHSAYMTHTCKFCPSRTLRTTPVLTLRPRAGRPYMTRRNTKHSVRTGLRHER